MRIVQLEENAKKNILSNLLKRDPNNYDSCTGTVQQIVDDMKERQDAAVFECTVKFDDAVLGASNVRVTGAEIGEVTGLVEPSPPEAMKKSMKNIRGCHQKQVWHSWFDSKPNGTILGQEVMALKSADAYVPGGKAAYPPSVLMNIIPAEVTGMKHIAMVTPPGEDEKVNPMTLTTAHLAGVTGVYKVGGARAVTALTFGTEPAPRVNKIVGPGNVFVALAKKAVYGHVNIDGVAEPSGILVLADEMAGPRFVATDLLSQAEHDELASVILMTASMELVKKMSVQVDEFVKELSRKEIPEKSLKNLGYILVADDMEDAIGTASEITSGHLEIVTKNPFEVMMKIQNAGAIFIGKYSPESLGDYFAGPNHVLPTSGTVKFFSPLGTDDSIEKSNIIYYSREAPKLVHRDIIASTEVEQLTVHTNSIKARFEEQVDQK